MDIKFVYRYGPTIVIDAENVHIEEDVETRTYINGPDGKVDYNIAPKRDVDTIILDQFTSVLDDLIECRVEKYDSSDLILRLFDKLPRNAVENVLGELNRVYCDDGGDE